MRPSRPNPSGSAPHPGPAGVGGGGAGRGAVGGVAPPPPRRRNERLRAARRREIELVRHLCRGLRNCTARRRQVEVVTDTRSRWRDLRRCRGWRDRLRRRGHAAEDRVLLRCRLDARVGEHEEGRAALRAAHLEPGSRKATLVELVRMLAGDAGDLDHRRLFAPFARLTRGLRESALFGASEERHASLHQGCTP